MAALSEFNTYLEQVWLIASNVDQAPAKVVQELNGSYKSTPHNTLRGTWLKALYKSTKHIG